MRTYKPRRPKASRDARVRFAVRCRADGLSLRHTARKAGVSYETVRRDLAWWDEQQRKVSHLPVTKTPPGGGNVTAPGSADVTAAVVPLRRTS